MLPVMDEPALKQFGAQVGALLAGGEVIELVGDVGAGKTTFVKGLAAGLGIDEDVQSPSFTISRVYRTPGNTLLAHYDFYRLNQPGIMAIELGEAVHDPRTVTVIEWAGVVAGVLPLDRLTIRFAAPTELTRQLTLAAGGPTSQALQEKLSDSAA